VFWNEVSTLFTCSLAAYRFASCASGAGTFGILLSAYDARAVTMIPKYHVPPVGLAGFVSAMTVPSFFAAGPSSVCFIFLMRQFFAPSAILPTQADRRCE
jgi:hypothetical protein